eukprot:g6020.t1
MATDAGNTLEEFKKLQREYQFLEQNRKDYAKESAQTIQRQQKLLDKLKKDNEYLKNEYRNHLRKPRGANHQSKLMELHDQVDQYTSKIAIEKRTRTELAKQARLMQRKILEVRKDMGGINAAKENQAMIAKQIRILENRLDKALVKFNQALSHNKKLREKIDNLRRERVVFDNIYKKLEHELQDKKRQMAEIIEESNQAYESRDKGQLEIAAIEQQNIKEQRQHDQQISELEQMEEKMKRDALARAGAVEETKRGELSMEEEKKLKRQVTKAAWKIVKEKTNITVSKEKVQTYEEAFQQIQSCTGITDIEELVKTFIQNEDQNFSLFNYVNGQTHEIEKLEEQVEELEEEKRKYTMNNTEDANQLLTKELTEKLENTNSTIEKLEQKFQASNKVIMALKIGIQKIFTKIECDVSSMSEMLHGEQVSESNMMQYLGMIEQRTNEILQQWASVEKRKGSINRQKKTVEEKESVLTNVMGSGPEHPMGEQKIQIAPPTMEDYSDVDADDSDDDVQMPRNLDAIKNEVMRYMSERTQARSDARHNRGVRADSGSASGHRNRARRAFGN